VERAKVAVVREAEVMAVVAVKEAEVMAVVMVGGVMEVGQGTAASRRRRG
jgi:hypothetical protein